MKVRRLLACRVDAYRGLAVCPGGVWGTANRDQQLAWGGRGADGALTISLWEWGGKCCRHGGEAWSLEG